MPDTSYDKYSFLAHLGLKDDNTLNSLMQSFSLNDKSMSNDSALFAHVDSSKNSYRHMLTDRRSYKKQNFHYEKGDVGPAFGLPSNTKELTLKLGNSSSTEKELDLVLLVQAVVLSAKNGCPYDIVLSHPLLDCLHATTRGDRMCFMILPACDGLTAPIITKHDIYDGKPDLDDIADNTKLCALLQKLRYCIPQEREDEQQQQVNEDEEFKIRPLKDDDKIVDILRPDTLEDGIYPCTVDNGKLKDTWVVINENHPYLTIYENVDMVKNYFERPEKEGGLNYRKGAKLKVKNAEYDTNMGKGQFGFPLKGVKYIQEWCRVNIYKNIKLADVRKENMSIKVTRLDGMPFDHSITNKEPGQDDGIRGLASLKSASLKDRPSSLNIDLKILCWPLPPPQPLQQDS